MEAWRKREAAGRLAKAEKESAAAEAIKEEADRQRELVRK